MNNFFRLDSLSSFMFLAIIFFFVLTLIYSSRFMKGKPQIKRYYSYVILTAIASLGVVVSNNLIALLAFWGFIGLALYLLINMGNENANLTAKKTLIIIGGSDALMLLGIALVYYLSQTFQIDKIRLELNNPIAVFAYLCIAAASFAKVGAIPFYSWIPDCAEDAPVPVAAYLPASLDKLLGIYLLARISLDLFVMNTAMNLFLMVLGSITIIIAVMMALMQHKMKKLLGFHAVSQVGYMVLGIGTGNPVGIAGGLFHMLNNVIYKTCLFFSAGNVEYRAKTTELEELGGLGKFMPLTYVASLIASLSISGVPPFNGFVSKWMVYQGLIENFNRSGSARIVVIFCLAAAMFGSVLTLASFIKLLHAVFFGPSKITKKLKISEVEWPMWLPGIILAFICVVFGVFAYQVPLKIFIYPVVSGVSFIGTWPAALATMLIIIGLFAGFIISRLKILQPRLRQDSIFVGGEDLGLEDLGPSGTEFYNTVNESGIFKAVYNQAEKGLFDIYGYSKRFVLSVTKVLHHLHNGVLPTYLVWMLLGVAGLFFILR